MTDTANAQIKKLETAGYYPLNIAFGTKSTAVVIDTLRKVGVKAIMGPGLDDATLRVLYLPVWMHAFFFLKKTNDVDHVLVVAMGPPDSPDSYEMVQGVEAYEAAHRGEGVRVPRLDLGEAEDIAALAKSPVAQALLVAEAALRSKNTMFTEWATKYANNRETPPGTDGV